MGRELPAFLICRALHDKAFGQLEMKPQRNTLFISLLIILLLKSFRTSGENETGIEKSARENVTFSVYNQRTSSVVRRNTFRIYFSLFPSAAAYPSPHRTDRPSSSQTPHRRPRTHTHAHTHTQYSKKHISTQTEKH